MGTATHTFGGSALDRHIFDFEAIPDADPGPGLDPAEDFGYVDDGYAGGEFEDPVSLSSHDLFDPGAEHEAAMAQYAADLQRAIDAQLGPIEERLNEYEQSRVLEDGEDQLAAILGPDGHGVPDEAHQQVREQARDLVTQALVEHVADQAGRTVEDAARWFLENPDALTEAWNTLVTDEVAHGALNTAAAAWGWENGGREAHYAGGGRITDVLTGRLGGHVAESGSSVDWRANPNAKIFDVLRARGGE